ITFPSVPAFVATVDQIRVDLKSDWERASLGVPHPGPRWRLRIRVQNDDEADAVKAIAYADAGYRAIERMNLLQLLHECEGCGRLLVGKRKYCRGRQGRRCSDKKHGPAKAAKRDAQLEPVYEALASWLGRPKATLKRLPPSHLYRLLHQMP